MPIDLQLPDNDETISIDEYVRALDDQSYDLSNHDDLIASAPLHNKLANNKDFLFDRIFDELRSEINFQQGNMYAPEVLLIHATPTLFHTSKYLEANNGSRAADSRI